MSKRPSQSLIKEWLRYDPETGAFVWIKEPRPNRPLIGQEAGTVSPNGYRRIRVRGFNQIGAHWLAWCYVHGFYVDGVEIDHKDGNASNNAIKNLRLATSSQQKQNRGVQTNNRSGLKGAYYHACRNGKKWRSQINVKDESGKKLHFIGYFNTAEEAHEAYLKAASKYFGEFAPDDEARLKSKVAV